MLSSKKKYKKLRLVLWTARVNYTYGKDCRNKVPMSAVGEETSRLNLQIFRVLPAAETGIATKFLH